MVFSFFKKINFKCTSGASAIEYGLISALIGGVVVTTAWESGQELSNSFNTVSNVLGNDRQETLDGFYDLTSEKGCNGFGSCGSQGNQGVWEGFKDIALTNAAFDNLMTDRQSFAIGIFNEARNKTRETMGLSGGSSWHSKADQATVRKASHQIWLDLAAEQEL